MARGISRKHVFLLILTLILFVNFGADISSQRYLGPDLQRIEDRLQEQGGARVIVMLGESPVMKTSMTAGGEAGDEIRQLEDSVLSRLNVAGRDNAMMVSAATEVGVDFYLKYRYSTVPAFAGNVTASGLEKLKNHPNVKGIYLDKKVHTMLQQSVPLINASEVWNKQVNGVYLTGEGQTICVIDTGVDYTHPAIGSAQCAPAGWQIDGTPTPHILEYQCSIPFESKIWTIHKESYSNIAVHFDWINTQKELAYIFVKDAEGNMVQAYSGDYTDEWTFSVPGDTIEINFTGAFGYGFRIDKVLDGYTAYTWQNCGDFIGGYDAVNFDMNPMDDDGHGTHVAGIITSDDLTYRGIAPDAKIVMVKALNEFGWGYDSTVLASIDGCVRYADLYNISVISLSLGTDCNKEICYSDYCDSSSSFTSFINKAAENNILVVAASGNNYDSSEIVEPACVRNAMPVGSTDDGSGGTTADEISSFSNRWSQPMIFAPGDSIYSTIPGEGFDSMEGTSMSVPHVSGVAALMYQYAELKGITLTPQEIEDILIATGKPVGGHSRIDALSAIEYMGLLRVSGYVFDSSGNPLANVPVELENETTIWLEGITNADGYFEFNLPQGEYGLYINMDGPILEGYTEADIGEDTPMIDLTSDIQINFTLWKINVSLETDSSNYNKGDTIEVNVTVENNEIYNNIENWEVGADMYFWNETYGECIEDSYSVNINSGEKKSFLLYLEIPENIVYGNWNLWGWVWKEEVEFESSKGPLQGEMGKEEGKEIYIITDYEQEIRNNYKALETAFESKDINSFMNYISLEYLDGCENYSDFKDEIQYLFNNYFDLELDFEIHNIIFSGDLAFVKNTGNWTGKNDSIMEGDSWFFEEDMWKKENNEWKWYGNQKRAWADVAVGYSVDGGHHFLRIRAETECEDKELISANVSGPGIIDEIAMDPYEYGEGFIAWVDPYFQPNVGDIYTFYLVYSDDYTEEINDTIENIIESGPTITYPQHSSTINESQPVFTWTDAGSAVNNQGYYWVRIGNETDPEIWDIELPLTETSVKYNVDGTAKEPLKTGHGYWLEVFIFDKYDNFANSRIYFNVSESLGYSLSGYVFDSAGNPLTNVPVELDIIWLLNKTDENGYFEFTNLLQGLYQLDINEGDEGYPPLEDYTTIEFEEENIINLTDNLEINTKLYKIDAKLELNASTFENGDTIKANVTVTNNEAFPLTNWALVLGVDAENGEYEELYFNLTPTSIAAEETKSLVFTYKIPENNTYDEMYVFGGTGSDKWSVVSSWGNLTALIYKIDEKEIYLGALPGDVNGDCVVNIFDLAAVGLAYGSQPGDTNWNPNTDVHPIGGNGVINIFDLATVGLNYGNTC